MTRHVTLLESEVGRNLPGTAARCVAPIHFAPGDAAAGGAINNGTIFFLDWGMGPLAVTADHVFQAYLTRKHAEPALLCRLGDLGFAPEERLIDRDADRDIAVFHIEAREVAELGADVHRPDYDWPPARPDVGGGVFFAGFPGRERRPGRRRGVAFGIYAATTVAASVNDRVVVCRFERQHWVDTLGLGSAPGHRHLGGLSGAPLWAVGGRDGAATLRLAGVVSSFNQGWELLYAKHAASIRPDGRLTPPQIGGLDRVSSRRLRGA